MFWCRVKLVGVYMYIVGNHSSQLYATTMYALHLVVVLAA